MNADEFGNYIKGLRKSKNMTIRQVELYSGVSHSYISQLENGKKGIPSPPVLKKISKAMKVSYDLLMEKAGYIEQDEESELKELLQDPQTDLMFKDWKSMDSKQREEAIQMIKFILYKDKNENNSK